ncbi:hypothetical protein PIB30_051875 [Stylosanthes scabra]|uniref:Uncharacterized protein n=1 Tax=Stylosanthes scabra TaxID=79078 RepID=A0ABU6TJ77_9FABA|nr:hypothetical protein [Stylosanthes scabra]
MGSGVIFYEYEKREKFEDYDMEAGAELGTFKIRRYHFDDESFGREVIYREISFVQASYAHYSSRRMPVTQRERSKSSVKGTRSFRCGATSSSLRKPRSWELILPSEGWMCNTDDKKEIGGMEPFVKNEESSEEDPKEDPDEEEEEPEEEDNPEDGIPATPSLPMDIDAEEDYQRYIEELGRVPEHSPLRSSQASVPDVPVEASNRQAVSHDGSSYNLSEVWQSQSSSPSS